MDDKVRKFVEQVRLAQGIDFPSIAAMCDLNWFRDLRPLLRTDPEFLAAMQEVLEEIRYALMHRMLLVGRDGKSRHGGGGEPAQIREVIKHIDSGAVLGLGQVKDDKEDEQVDPKQEKLRLMRLGYSEEEADELTKKA